MTIEGIVVSEPEMHVSASAFILKIGKITYNSVVQYGAGTLLVYTLFYPEVKYGDYLYLDGQLKSPSSFFRNGNIDKASVQSFAKRLDIQGLMSFPKISLQFSAIRFQGSVFFVRILKEIKKSLITQVGLIYPEPYAGFLLGILLGVKNAISKVILDNLQSAGLSHIIVVSGYNVSLISIFFLQVFIFMHKYWRVLLSLFFIWLFSLIVGLEAPVLRASLMITYSAIALFLGRPVRAELSILLAAFIISVISPQIVLFDHSFMLSFGSTLGLCWFFEFFRKLLSKMNLPEFIILILAATLSSQVFILPYIWYYFGQLPLLAPITNVLVLPLIPFIMIGGIGSIVLSFISLDVARLLSFPVAVMIDIVFKIAEIAS